MKMPPDRACALIVTVLTFPVAQQACCARPSVMPSFTRTLRENTNAELYLGSRSSAHARSGGDRAMVRAYVRRRGDPLDATRQATHRYQARRRHDLHGAGQSGRWRESAAHDAL